MMVKTRRSHIYCPPDIDRAELLARLLRLDHDDQPHLTRGFNYYCTPVAGAYATGGVPTYAPPA